jgi:gamma-glutamyltranspeptidase/glutathione hydrolase
VAEDMVAAVQGAGGVLTLEDLKNYQVVERMPLTGSYEAGGKHYTVVTMPSPSSGGTALLELLGATQGVLSLQCEVEAAKYAMARRALSAGDGSDAAVDPARIAAIRADCGPKTYVSEHYGVLVAPGNSGGTSHISVLDSSGMAIALTTTINTPFGSKLIAPKSGILLNDQMDDFTTKPGQPNAFGLIQSEANAIMPGKRPLSSMTPTLLLDEQGRVVMAVGGSGGPFIITATYQVIRNILDYGLSPQEAVSVPRWHHQWLPDQVMLEPDFLKRAELEAAGHAIREIKGFSTVQVVIASKGGYIGGADPRKGGSAVLAE